MSGKFLSNLRLFSPACMKLDLSTSSHSVSILGFMNKIMSKVKSSAVHTSMHNLSLYLWVAILPFGRNTSLLHRHFSGLKRLCHPHKLTELEVLPRCRDQQQQQQQCALQQSRQRAFELSWNYVLSWQAGCSPTAVRSLYLFRGNRLDEHEPCGIWQIQV